MENGFNTLVEKDNHSLIASEDALNKNEIQKETQNKKKLRRVGTAEEGKSNVLSSTDEFKNVSVKITFEGEVARRILKCETDLKDRLSKPDMGKILGQEILSWNDKRWAEIIEEHTDIEFFFAQIRKCPDRGKSIKQLKLLAEKLKKEPSEEAELSGDHLEVSQTTATIQ